MQKIAVAKSNGGVRIVTGSSQCRSESFKVTDVGSLSIESPYVTSYLVKVNVIARILRYVIEFDSFASLQVDYVTLIENRPISSPSYI